MKERAGCALGLSELARTGVVWAPSCLWIHFLYVLMFKLQCTVNLLFFEIL